MNNDFIKAAVVVRGKEVFSFILYSILGGVSKIMLMQLISIVLLIILKSPLIQGYMWEIQAAIYPQFK